MVNLPELTCYFNGEFIKESEIKLKPLDKIMRGSGVFDVGRTYNHKPFFWKEHIDRLYRSLSYCNIDPAMTQEKMYDIHLEVLRCNEENLDPGDDFIVMALVSGGTSEYYLGPVIPTPTILINCAHLSPIYPEEVKFYREGIHLVVVSQRQYPPEALSSQVKHCSRLNLYKADQEARLVDPEAFALLLDCRGFIAEGTGFNVLWVKDGKLFLPTPENILPGVTQSVILGLAKELGIEVVRGNYTVYDLYAADEIFRTGTSYTITAVSKFNERTMPKPIPGPVTQRLFSAFYELVGVDLIERVQHVISYDKVKARR